MTIFCKATGLLAHDRMLANPLVGQPREVGVRARAGKLNKSLHLVDVGRGAPKNNF